MSPKEVIAIHKEMTEPCRNSRSLDGVLLYFVLLLVFLCLLALLSVAPTPTFAELLVH